MSSEVTNILLYDNPANFTFDAALLEISASKMQLKNQIDPNEQLYGDFATKDLLRSAGGSLVGTLNGTASITAGVLDLLGGAVAYWSIDPTGMLGADPNIVTLKFKVRTGYSGTPGSTQTFLAEQAGTVDNKNQILIQHISGTGNVNMVFRNSAGAGAGTVVAKAAWNPTAGVWYDFELNVNSTTGTQKLAIDGIFGPDNAATYVRDNNIGTIQHGGSGITSNFEIDDLQRFDTIKHTIDFPTEVPNVAPLTDYSTASPSALSVTVFGMTDIKSIIETATKAGLDELKFTLYFAGVDHYISGGVMVVSDGTYAQSNTATEWSVATMDIDPDTTVQIRTFFHSDDGTTTPDLTSLSLTFDFYAAQINPTRCVVYGYLLDNQAVPTEKQITIKSKKPFFLEGNSISINVLLEDSDFHVTGYWRVSLPETTSINTLLEVVETWTDSESEEQEHKYKILVPAQSTAEAENIAA